MLTTLAVRLAENLREARSALGVSQERLADIAGLHRTYIGAVERAERNITLSTLEKIADALNVDASELLRCRSRSISSAE